MTALEELKTIYRRREQTAQAWQAAGGRVAGYIGTDVPEELLLAGGFLPLRVGGRPGSSTALADQYLGPTFNGLARTMFNRLLDGTYAFLDRLIIPNSPEAVLRLFYYLREIKRLEPRPEIPDFYFFELLHTRYRTSTLYNRDRVRDFKQRLEGWVGQEITNEALRSAIAVCNENRRLLQKVARLRAEPLPRLSGVEALQIIGAAMYMLKADHTRLLHQLLDDEERLPVHPGARLFVGGSSLDLVSFYEIVESYNAVVVAEDNDWGNRYFDTLVDETADPLDAITDRYHYKAPAPARSTIQRRVDYCQRQALAAGAEGAIFFILSGDNPASWDYPEQRKALEAHGIPTLLLHWQPYAGAGAAELRARIEPFVSAIVQPAGVTGAHP